VTLFPLAPRPSNEAARSAAVLDSGLLQSIDDPALNAICVAAKTAASSDWAGIAIIIGDAQSVIASSGGLIGHYDRDRSMTAHAIMTPFEVLNLADARSEPRFAANSFARVGLIRFFVAVPIVDERQFALGALCVSSRKPRAVADEQTVRALRALADRVLQR
jgi:GAF domain-containing protein